MIAFGWLVDTVERTFYDASTGERLYDDNGYGLATESGEIRFA